MNRVSKYRVNGFWGCSLTYLGVAVALVFLFPFLWILTTSLGNEDYSPFPPVCANATIGAGPLLWTVLARGTAGSISKGKQPEHFDLSMLAACAAPACRQRTASRASGLGKLFANFLLLLRTMPNDSAGRVMSSTASWG